MNGSNHTFDADLAKRYDEAMLRIYLNPHLISVPADDLERLIELVRLFINSKHSESIQILAINQIELILQRNEPILCQDYHQ